MSFITITPTIVGIPLGTFSGNPETHFIPPASNPFTYAVNARNKYLINFTTTTVVTNSPWKSYRA